jgi:hypothetical protein
MGPPRRLLPAMRGRRLCARRRPARMGPRWGGVFSMDDHRHATAAVLDQTEDEKFLAFTPSDEDLERAADGTPWAQTNTCVRTICFSEQPVRKAVVSRPVNR